jgi:hypothetical protein
MWNNVLQKTPLCTRLLPDVTLHNFTNTKASQMEICINNKSLTKCLMMFCIITFLIIISGMGQLHITLNCFETPLVRMLIHFLVFFHTPLLGSLKTLLIFFKSHRNFYSFVWWDNIYWLFWANYYDTIFCRRISTRRYAALLDCATLRALLGATYPSGYYTFTD